MLAAFAGCASLDGLVGATDDEPPPKRNDRNADAATADATTTPDDRDVVTTDAGARPCDPAAPFGEPVLLAEIDLPGHEAVSDLSPDELTLYYVTTVTGSTGVHIAMRSRATATSPFGPASYPFGLPASDDWSVAISADGLSAVLSTARSGTAGVDMFQTSRPSPADTFGNLTKLTGLNSSADEQGSQLSADGKTFYFDSTRSGARDLYRAPVTVGGFGAPEPIAELNTPNAVEAVPVLSADELTIYFHSTRGSDPTGDIWMAKRASKQAPFTDIALVPNVNAAGAADAPGFVSRDDCRLYMSSMRGPTGEYAPYVASRPK